MNHYSVLLNEAINLLQVNPDGIYVDGTLGRGGHSLAILKQLKTGHLYCFDKDIQAIEQSKERLKEYLNKVTFIHDSFENVEQYVSKIDGFILDLGVSSPQFDDPERGFSYRFDAVLDMRMNQQQKLSALDVVNTYDYHALCKMLYENSEEFYAKQIARGIEKYRPIHTTFELVDVIKKSLPAKVLSQKGHPAKKTFQAIRIEVNNELTILSDSVNTFCRCLKKNGRGVIITFHSLEDRIVKNAFQNLSNVPKINKRIPVLPNEIQSAPYRLLNKKVILASSKELEENKRSHSAKLRGIERIK